MIQANKHRIKVGDTLSGNAFNSVVIKVTDKTCTTEAFDDYGRYELQRTWNTINKRITGGLKLIRS